MFTTRVSWGDVEVVVASGMKLNRIGSGLVLSGLSTTNRTALHLIILNPTRRIYCPLFPHLPRLVF